MQSAPIDFHICAVTSSGQALTNKLCFCDLPTSRYSRGDKLFSLILGQIEATDRQAESNTYQPIMQIANVGSKIETFILCKVGKFSDQNLNNAENLI